MNSRSARFLVLLTVLVAGCQRSEAPQSATTNGASSSGNSIQIQGAGATFPNPIYSKWFSDYNKLHPNVMINYQSIGSGGGIKQLSAETVFFGASDGPMSDDQLKAAGRPILHFPTVLGGVVPIYSVPGVTQQIKFSGDVLAGIYLGKITKWNDPAIAKINAGVSLPATDIGVVHRAEASGTTYIFLDYLAKVSPELKQKIGVNTAVSWPVGVGAKGNEGVSGLVKQTPGAIGYVELIYALQNKIPYGSVQNKAGDFVVATLDSVTTAANAAAATMPDDFRVSITNSDAKGAYPLSSFTWLLLDQNPTDKVRGRIMSEFVQWAITEGQKAAPGLGYAPLPQSVVEKEQAALKKIQL
jgi:phosphate transport system substrate-binding protein